MTKIASVSDLIVFHEGRRNRPYKDTQGKLTIGVGHCLDTKPLPDRIIDDLFLMDAAEALEIARAVFGAAAWDGFGPERQAALQDMAFELGDAGLRGFLGMRSAIERGDWNNAAACALQSKWAEQVPARAKMDAEILRTGQWPA